MSTQKIKELKQISDALDKRELALNELERQFKKQIQEFNKRTKNYKLAKPIYAK